MNRRCLRTLAACAALFLCKACVAPGPSDPTMSAQADDASAYRDQQLEALSEFSFNGGLGIWNDNEAHSARLRWSQSPGQLTVNLNAPLNLGSLELVGGPELSTLSRGDSVLASGPSIDLVVQQGLGLSVPVPIDQLQLWVRGLPGQATDVRRDSAGGLESLRYRDAGGLNWQARFRRYTRVDTGDSDLALPALITASSDEYSMRLVLKNWQVTAPSPVPEAEQSHKRLAIPGR